VIKLVKFLLGLCDHKWQEVSYDNFKDVTFSEIGQSKCYVQCRCEKCGKFKTFIIRGTRK